MNESNSRTAGTGERSAVNLPDVDPAFEERARFARAANGVTRQVEDLRRRHLYSDGTLTVKTKVLMSLLWSVSARCEPCVAYYGRRAREIGASEAEVGETLAVATTMGACVAETWGVKAFAAATAQSDTPECAC